MKQNKRIISLLLAVVMAVSVFLQVDFGTNASGNVNTDVSGVHIRDVSGKLLVFLTNHDYGSAGATQSIINMDTCYNTLSKIVVYKSDSVYSTLADLMSQTGASGERYYNIWGETGSIAIDLPDGWDGKTIKKIVFEQGCEFPSYAYTNGGSSTKTSYVLTENITYTTNTSSDFNVDWTRQQSDVKHDTDISKLQIRDSSGKLLVFPTVHDYAGAGATKAITNMDTLYNTLSNIVVYKSDSVYSTLADLMSQTGASGERYYNIWGETGSIAIDLPDGWDGKTIKKIVFKQGCEFPSYAYTSGGTTTKTSYVLTTERTYVTSTSATDNLDWTQPSNVAIFDTDISKLQIRDNSGKLLVFPTVHDYAGAGATKTITNMDTLYNTLSNIVVYKSDSVYSTLADLMSQTGASGERYYNIWGETGSIAIDLPDGWDGKTIKKIVFKQGCEFPSYAYTSGGTTTRTSYVLTEDRTFVTNTSANDNLDWTQPPNVAAFDTDISGLQMRDASGKLLIFPTVHDYANAGATKAIANMDTTYNTLSNIVVYKSDSEYSTLADLMTLGGASGERYYNIWGETGSIAIDLPDGWDGKTIKKIVLKQGCEFPSYAYTSGGTTTRTSYVLTADRTYVTYTSALDNLDWTYPVEKENHDTSIDRVAVRDASGKLLIYPTVHDYASAGATTSLTNLNKYNTLENIVVYKSDSEFKTLAELQTLGGVEADRYYNIWGENGSIAIDMPDDWNGTTIKKIVFKQGCQFPSYQTTSGGINKLISYLLTEDMTYITKTSAIDNMDWNRTYPSTPISTTVQDVKLIGATGDVRVIFFLETNDYDAAESSFAVSNRYADFDTFEKVLLYLNGAPVQLTELITGDEVYYNLWGNQGTVSYALKSEYAADDFSKVEILAGCEFPSYSYTSTDAVGKPAYTTTTTQVLEIEQSMFSVSYFDENGQLLYTDEFPCGSTFVLRPIPSKTGYVGSWEGLTYTVMPAQNIEYRLSYEKAEVVEETPTEPIEPQEPTEKDEEEKAPVMGDANRLVWWSVLMAGALAVVLVITKRKWNSIGE